MEKMPWVVLRGAGARWGGVGGGGGTWPAPGAPASACMGRCWGWSVLSPRRPHPLSLPAPHATSFPPLASLPWARASAPSWPPDTASSSSDADSGLRSFCAHRCGLPCARPVQGEQGGLSRGLVGKAAKPHVGSRSTSSCFLPRAPARHSQAAPAILFKAPGLAPCSITPRIIRGLVWTTLLSIWPIKLRTSRCHTCVS